MNLEIIPKHKEISLADPKMCAKIVGETKVDISLNNNVHSSIIVEVIKNLFVDLIIGKDILGRYKMVTFKFDGPEEELIIGAVTKNTFFPSMNVSPPPLFSHLSTKTTPISTKSRRHTIADSKFIRAETAKLLEENVIEPSISPWRAQVLVTSNENRKKKNGD